LLTLISWTLAGLLTVSGAWGSRSHLLAVAQILALQDGKSQICIAGHKVPAALLLSN